MVTEMGNRKGKMALFVNDALRDYVYCTYKRSKLMRIARIALLIVVATVVGDAYARYMVPVPTPVASSGTFLDGYRHRYWFEMGAVMFIFAFTVVRYLFRAICRAYVRHLDMDDAIRAGGVKPNASDADTTGAPSRSRRYAGSMNGDYVSAVDSREDTISESKGGDA